MILPPAMLFYPLPSNNPVAGHRQKTALQRGLGVVVNKAMNDAVATALECHLFPRLATFCRGTPGMLPKLSHCRPVLFFLLSPVVLSLSTHR